MPGCEGLEVMGAAIAVCGGPMPDREGLLEVCEVGAFGVLPKGGKFLGGVTFDGVANWFCSGAEMDVVVGVPCA